MSQLGGVQRHFIDEPRLSVLGYQKLQDQIVYLGYAKKQIQRQKDPH